MQSDEENDYFKTNTFAKEPTIDPQAVQCVDIKNEFEHDTFGSYSPTVQANEVKLSPSEISNDPDHSTEIQPATKMASSKF